PRKVIERKALLCLDESQHQIRIGGPPRRPSAADDRSAPSHSRANAKIRSLASSERASSTMWPPTSPTSQRKRSGKGRSRGGPFIQACNAEAACVCQEVPEGQGRGQGARGDPNLRGGHQVVAGARRSEPRWGPWMG